MRVVLDTNVLVAALRSDQGASRQLMAGALTGRYRLLASASLLIEYEAVLKRDEHRMECGASIEDIDTVLDGLVRIAERVDITYFWRPQLADPGDELVLETAVNGQADLIVSFDLRHLRSAAARFGIKVERPGSVVHRLRDMRP